MALQVVKCEQARDLHSIYQSDKSLKTVERMGKLLKSLLGSALIASARSQSDTSPYEVVSCNNPSDHATDPHVSLLKLVFFEQWKVQIVETLFMLLRDHF